MMAESGVALPSSDSGDDIAPIVAVAKAERGRPKGKSSVKKKPARFPRHPGKGLKECLGEFTPELGAEPDVWPKTFLATAYLFW